MGSDITAHISDEVWAAVMAARNRTGNSIDAIVEDALSEALGIRRHSIFQVSTSGALVEGVFTGATTVGDLQTHGDFGLGTFDGLDGELIMIDGVCLRAGAGGVVSRVATSETVPFAVVTRFASDRIVPIGSVAGMDDLESALDEIRPSDNLFVGIRIDVHAHRLDLRAACPAREGEGLLAATRHQSEFTFTDASGTLVGFWTPAYAKAINIPGYHFHWIDDDRSRGGHVLDIDAHATVASLHLETDVHVAIPTTIEFLRADLAGDPTHDLDLSESSSDSGGRSAGGGDDL